MKGQIDKAIELYTKIIQELESTPDLYQELSLFNKVGDLYLKLGSVQPAVEMYERAANLYAESGLPNNAIALCNKILRNAPGRTQVYLKLAQLMVLRGFVAEAKQNLLEYAERMQRAGKLEDAFQALKEFADLSPANEEIRLLLAEQLKAAARSDEAREQLDKLYSELQATGDARRSRMTLEKIRAIDPEYDLEGTSAKPATPVKTKTSDLVFLDLDDTPDVVRSAGDDEAAPLVADTVPDDLGLDIQRTQLGDLTLDEEGADLTLDDEGADLLEIERSSAEFDLGATESGKLEGLEVASWEGEQETPDLPPLDIEPTALEEAPLLEDEEEDLEDFDDEQELPLIQVPDADEGQEDVEFPFLAVSAEEEADAGPAELPLIDASGEYSRPGEESDALALAEGGEIEAPDLDLGGVEDDDTEAVVVVDTGLDAGAGSDVATLESRVADDPDDPGLHRELAEALIERGERTRGLEELNLAFEMYEAEGEWAPAEAVVNELLRLDPNSARHHQKRVELAFRTGDRGTLVAAYLGLADALVRTDDLDRARLVYHRVLEHDPENESAKASIAALEPAEAAEAAAAAGPGAAAAEARKSGYVDLGAFLLEDEPRHERDTRMRIEEEEPTGDEQKDFERMLSRFKRGIEVNISEEDAQAHYDLGIAFKEMGLLDEAISEFQKALRASDGRLKSTEALGVCFFEKGQYSVAATVLRRAIDSEAGSDDLKIGLLYWLGRSEEELEQSAEALQHYQRVFAVDINFGDVSERVRALAGTRS